MIETLRVSICLTADQLRQVRDKMGLQPSRDGKELYYQTGFHLPGVRIWSTPWVPSNAHLKVATLFFEFTPALLIWENNLVTAGPAQLFTSIGKLEAHSGLDLDTAVVGRIDLALTPQTKFDAAEYLDRILYYPGKRITTHGGKVGGRGRRIDFDDPARTESGKTESKEVRSGSFKLSIYDKGRQLLCEYGLRIEGNRLRIEIQQKKNVARAFKLKRITVADFRRYEVWDKLCAGYLARVRKIGWATSAQQVSTSEKALVETILGAALKHPTDLGLPNLSLESVVDRFGSSPSRRSRVLKRWRSRFSHQSDGHLYKEEVEGLILEEIKEILEETAQLFKG